MTSVFHAVAFAAAMLISSAALADQTVAYKGEDGRTLTLEIADSGAVRVSGPVPGQEALALNDEFYMLDTAGAETRVMRIRDVAAAVEQIAGPLFKGLFGAAAQQPQGEARLTIEAAGTASVAGHTGERYRIKGLGDTDQPVEWIASRDPALAPAGQAIQKFMEAGMVMAAPMLGDAAAGMIGEMRQAFALGTPLNAGGKFELVSVSDGAIDAARFTLPAEPLAVADIVKALQGSRPPETE